MKPLVLIYSKDVELYLFLRHILGVDGIGSELATDVNEVFAMPLKSEPQAVILDWQPASVAGPTISANVKQELRPDIPVIALIAPGAQNQLLDLFKAGIDQILMRPLEPAKLLHCLHTTMAIGQTGIASVATGSLLTCGNLQMELVTHRVLRDGHEIHLGLIEFNLLRHLLENPGKVFSREELIGAAWPDNIHVSVRTVDVHISHIKRACGISIRTVRSRGYSLEPSDD
ncbi:response regulator [Sinorhizobium meliloti]|nr:response regulator [Sinorhizobium meliloti]